MHRFLYLARPRADLTPAEFEHGWLAHAQLAATCPDVLAEIRGYRQWQVVDPGADGVVGVAETRCVDAAGVYRMLQCAGTREVLQPDELRFLAWPCRAAGLVADEALLDAASDRATPGVAHDFACLWLAPRHSPLDAGSVKKLRSALERRIEQLRSLLRAVTNKADVMLSSGYRDSADELGVFDALLFMRFHEASVAKAVAMAWRLAAQPGEKVFHLQRPARESQNSEMPR